MIRLFGRTNWLTPAEHGANQRQRERSKVTVKLPASVRMVNHRLLQEIDAVKYHDDRQFAMGLLYLKLTAK